MDISSECRETTLTTRKDNRTEIFKYVKLTSLYTTRP
jgi:hypothetical protein